MRFVLISDVHGNLEALRAVQTQIEKCVVQPRQLMVLGDNVGGGPNPGECLDVIGDTANLMLCGKSDLIIAGERVLERTTPSINHMMFWTRTQISEEERQLLANLPIEYVDGQCVYSHGAFHQPDKFMPVRSEEMVKELFDHCHQRFICTGSTHRPCIVIYDERTQRVATLKGERRCSIEKGKRYLINPGSVGNPQDNDERASFALIDFDGKFIDLVRVPFDWRTTERKMKAARLSYEAFL